MATITLSPDPRPEISSIDGITIRQATETFSDIRDGVGTGAFNGNTQIYVVHLQSSGATTFNNLRRGIFTFDGSAIPAGATFTQAVIQLYVSNKGLSGYTAGNSSFDITEAELASNTSLVASDYERNKDFTTAFATLAYTGVTTGQYNTWTLNASGLAYLNAKTDRNFKFCTKTGWDRSDTSPATGGFVYYDVRMADAKDATIPKLILTYEDTPTPTEKTRPIGGAIGYKRRHL